MPKPPAVLNYRPEIDGLRALAVGVVVMFHAGLGFSGGYVGVDVFFVISGFLITSLLLRELDAGTFSLADFYERRARRILPASLAITLVVLGVGYYALLPLDLEWLGLSAVAHAGFAANVFFSWRTANYFGGSASGMPLLHMWSLAVEEQFYLLFPFVLLLCHRLSRRGSRALVTAVFAVLCAASFALNVHDLPSRPVPTFFLLPTRAWELMIGSILAVVPHRRVSRVVREAVAWAGLAAVLVPAWCYTPDTAFPGLAALPPCAGAALFIWAGQGEAGVRQAWLGRALASRVPVFVGAMSYSLYLVHWPILVFGKYWQLVSPTLGQRLGWVALSFAAGVVSWRFVETPFRRRTLCATRRTLFASAAVGLVVIVLAGGAFRRAGGVPGRFSENVNRLDQIRREKPHLAQLEAADVDGDALTPFGDADPSTPVGLLLWGDSHAGAVLPAFNEACRAHGIKGRAATHSSVAPLLDYAPNASAGLGPGTTAYNRAVVDYVGRHRVPVVFLVNYWKRDLEEDPQALVAALGRTVDALRAAGARVYVLLQIPGYGVEVPKALAYEALHDRVVPAWRKTPAAQRREQADLYAFATKHESDDCRFVDPVPFFLRPRETYLTVADHGRSVYRDSHHLTVWGAKRMLVPMLEELIVAEPKLNRVAATTRPTTP